MIEFSQKIDTIFAPTLIGKNSAEIKIIEAFRKRFRKYFTDTDYVIEELGLAAFHFKFQFIKEKLERLCSEINSQSTNLHFPKILEEILKDLNNLYDMYLNETKFLNIDEINKQILYKMTSVKVKYFLQQIKLAYQNEKISFHSIVFVERRETAYILNQLLNSLADGEWSFISCDFVLGSNDDLIMMTSKEQACISY
jgi:hypothetical protein